MATMQPDPLAEFFRAQIEVEHARCDAILRPPDDHWDKSPQAEWLREAVGMLDDLVFAQEDILRQYEQARTESAADVAVVDALEYTVRRLATAYAGREGWREEWRP